MVEFIARFKDRNLRSYTKRMCSYTNRTYALLYKPYECAPTQTVRMRYYTNRACSYTNRAYVFLHKPHVCAPTQNVCMCSYTNRTYVFLNKPYVCVPTQTIRMRSYRHYMCALRMIVMINIDHCSVHLITALQFFQVINHDGVY